MVGEARDAQLIAAGLLERGVYAVGFFYPVVPNGEARIRVQVSALHEIADLDFVVEQLAAVRGGMAARSRSVSRARVTAQWHRGARPWRSRSRRPRS